ncbi:MAG: histidine phosphatase family protein [Thermomicrobiales bacterium]
MLIRHGRTAANRAGVFQGSMDVTLDEFGVRQAQAVCARVAAEYPVDHIVCSTLSRARATAAPLALLLNLDPEYEPDLQEMSFGEYEGKTWAEIERLDPAFVARLEDYADESVTWPGGESRAGFHHRIWQAMERVVHHHHGRRVAIVSHGGVIGAFMALLRGQVPGDPSVYGLRNCSITYLHVRDSHTEVHRFNDVDHLSGIEEFGETREIDL